jgi:hypothetical protein
MDGNGIGDDRVGGGRIRDKLVLFPVVAFADAFRVAVMLECER